MNVHVAEALTPPPRIAFDDEVFVIDVGFQRSPGAASHTWVLHSAFATVEDDGRVVDLEIALPRGLVRRTSLELPPLPSRRYSLFVDHEGAADAESYLYDASRSIVSVRFAPTSPRAVFYPLADTLAVELHGVLLGALWFSLKIGEQWSATRPSLPAKE